VGGVGPSGRKGLTSAAEGPRLTSSASWNPVRKVGGARPQTHTKGGAKRAGLRSIENRGAVDIKAQVEVRLPTGDGEKRGGPSKMGLTARLYAGFGGHCGRAEVRAFSFLPISAIFSYGRPTWGRGGRLFGSAFRPAAIIRTIDPGACWVGEGSLFFEPGEEEINLNCSSGWMACCFSRPRKGTA